MISEVLGRNHKIENKPIDKCRFYLAALNNVFLYLARQSRALRAMTLENA